ncbi:MAG: hypothetical protein Q7V48_15315 [Deltaproteobacteria bacterium]|nr:hypothetical protein [Deltaproteobacteria bacterium]
MEIKKSFNSTMPPQVRNKDQETFNHALWAMREKERLTELTTPLKEGEEVQVFLSPALLEAAEGAGKEKNFVFALCPMRQAIL